MKSGTAQKMVLNMISTVAMIRLGYVKGNRMTNVKPANEKLKDRSLRILIAETNLDASSAAKLLSESDGDLRVALVMFNAGIDRRSSEQALDTANFSIQRAIENAKK